jgi:hypothetical protein
MLALVGCGSKHNAKTPHDEDEKLEASPGIRCINDAKTRLTPPTDAPERMDLAHILVRHAGVRDAGDTTRTREEACLRAAEARKKLLGGGDWETVYEEYSDSKGATDGVLFDVTQGSLDAIFAGAAFSLKIDELSYPVETKRGFHIIWRKK